MPPRSPTRCTNCNTQYHPGNWKLSILLCSTCARNGFATPDPVPTVDTASIPATPTPTKACEVLSVNLTDRDGQQVTLVVPSYTRSMESFQDEIGLSVLSYLRDAVVDNTSLSVADFALWLLTRAAVEPIQEGVAQ